MDLEKLLWVRPRHAKQALTACEILLGTGFPLVVADLGLYPRGARYLPDAVWVRLARAAESRVASLLLLTPWRVSGIAAEAVITTDSSRPQWHGDGKTPPLLTGLSSNLTLQKYGRLTPGNSSSLHLSVLEACHPLASPSCHPFASPSCHPSASPSCHPLALPPCHSFALPPCHPERSEGSAPTIPLFTIHNSQFTTSS